MKKLPNAEQLLADTQATLIFLMGRDEIMFRRMKLELQKLVKQYQKDYLLRWKKSGKAID